MRVGGGSARAQNPVTDARGSETRRGTLQNMPRDRRVAADRVTGGASDRMQVSDVTKPRQAGADGLWVGCALSSGYRLCPAWEARRRTASLRGARRTASGGGEAGSASLKSGWQKQEHPPGIAARLRSPRVQEPSVLDSFKKSSACLLTHGRPKVHAAQNPSD